MAADAYRCWGFILGAALIATPAAAQGPTLRPIGFLDPAERKQEFERLEATVADFEQHHQIFKRLVRLVGPSVVHIDAETTENVRGRSHSVQEAGSGVVIEQGQKFYVLTNRHVVDNASLANITIRFGDGATQHPSRLWEDRDTDLAVLALSGTNYIPARLGDSDRAEIGDFVVAVGSPFGLSHSFTYGIISAKGRRDLKELAEAGVKYQDYLQTDAAINPGNSGGPLFNLRGEVIGINAAIASKSGSNEGIGFSVPINMTLRIARQLIERGSVVRPKLGVKLDSAFTHDKARNVGLPRLVGARIIEVFAGSTAQTHGLRDGDVIIRFDGSEVENDTHLVHLIALAEVGTDVAVEVMRDRKPVTLTVRFVAPQ